MKSLSLLAISVGNTRTRIGAFVERELAESATVDNRDPASLAEALEHAFSPLRNHEHARVVLASVNPPIAERIAAVVAEKFQRTPLRVERDLPVPIGRQLDPEAIIGEDRLLNAAAAFDVLQQACVVVDAGTAITVDFVDGQGTLHGGAIAPGAQLQLDALHQRTAQLPEIEFDKPAEQVGHNTIEAMRVGVYHGLRGLVHELTEQYADVAGAFPTVIATGGDGAMLFKDDERVDRFVPDLTLMGIALTYRVAIERAEREEQKGGES
jgi:type III pantothenate kinase